MSWSTDIPYGRWESDKRFEDICEARNLGRYYHDLDVKRNNFIKYFAEAKARAERKAEREAQWRANREHEQLMGMAVSDDGQECSCGGSNCQPCREQYSRYSIAVPGEG